MKIEAAIKYLYKQYEKAKTMDYVKKPLAWALYQTWRYVDKEASINDSMLCRRVCTQQQRLVCS